MNNHPSRPRARSPRRSARIAEACPVLFPQSMAIPCKRNDRQYSWLQGRASILACSLLLTVAPVFAAGPADRNIKLESSSGRGLTAIVSSHPLIWDSLRIQGRQYQSVRVPEFENTSNPGDPQLPAAVLLVGLPPEGGARVTVQPGLFSERQGVRLIPSPAFENREWGWEQRYEEGPVYRGGDFWPEALYRVEEPEWYGRQRILRITVFPLQYRPFTGTLRAYSELRVNVEFERGGGAVLPEKAGGGSPFILNAEQAGRWIRQAGPAMRKPSFSFSQGRWFRISISEEDVYQITGAFLKGKGVELASIEPSTMKIYNNGGQQLPVDVAAAKPDSLIENPVIVSGTEDDRFDESDYLLFYGRGVSGWRFDGAAGRWVHDNNIFSDRNVYWLVFNDGVPRMQMATKAFNGSAAGSPVTRFRDRVFFEQDNINPYSGGIHWFAHQFLSPSSSRNYEILMPDPVPGESMDLRIRTKYADNTSRQFTFNVSLNQVSWATFNLSAALPKEDSRSAGASPVSGINTFGFEYRSYVSPSSAYLDWFEVSYVRELKLSDGRLVFYSPDEPGEYFYPVGDLTTDAVVLDITDPLQARRIIPGLSSGACGFFDSAGETPRRYFAVDPSRYRVPESFEGKEQWADLRTPGSPVDMIILTHRDFLSQAQRLEEHRETIDSLSVMVVDVQDVFDEFGWGLPDPAAIRNFVQYAFVNWDPPPAYLLLFGDGDYDYRNRLSDRDKNWIPPFEQSGYSDLDGSTRAMDDYYGYVSGPDKALDIAVGRLPVQTASEAEAVVGKIIAYDNSVDFGDWRAHATVIGDDEIGEPSSRNETVHIEDAEIIAEDYVQLSFNVRKVYLTEYPVVYAADGRRKPAATEDLLDQINRGTLIVDFLGHGHEAIWAHEALFLLSRDMDRLENVSRWPLFYAATCEFGLYDDFLKQSFSEVLLNEPDKGGIAVISASRRCSPTPNAALNRSFIRSLFAGPRPTERIGEALRRAKIMRSESYPNNEQYNLFGDPSMRLAAPRLGAVLTDIEPDTLQALGVVTAKGHVEDDEGLVRTFQGHLILRAFDARKPVSYLNVSETVMNYILPGNPLFLGQAAVRDGQFSVSFIVPKDISYGETTGRISAYLWDGQKDGSAYQNGIALGGSADSDDEDGPEIQISFAGRDPFMPGDMISGDPELVATIRDEKSGVNITGEIGHKIVLTIDEERREDVSEYFSYLEGSYTEGELRYVIDGLAEGDHKLLLKAWDNANNSSVQDLDFRVVSGEDLRLEEVYPYPNPMQESTAFTFKLSSAAEVSIRIFTVEGRMIRALESVSAPAGFSMISWDGRDAMGNVLANGVYFFRVAAVSRLGDKTLKAEKIERVLVMR